MSRSRHSETRGTIVVGVDGSEGAKHALRWAAAEARLRGSRLLIVHAWRFGYAGVPGGGYGSLGGPFDPFPGGGVSDMHRAAEELLEKVTAELDGDAEGVEIERRVVEGAEDDVLDVPGGDHARALGVTAGIEREPLGGNRTSVRLPFLEPTVEAVNHDLDPRWPLIRRLERLRYDLAHCAVPPDASTGLPSVQLAKAPGRIS